MIEKVIKRDGRVEDFVARKLNGWGEWSSKNLGSTVDWSGVVLHVVNILPKTTTSKAIQEAAIRYCLDKRTWEYNLMAGRLYAALMLKEIHGGKYPTVKEVHKQLQEVGIMRVLDYSDEEYAQVEKIINHSLNLKSAHYSLFQTRTKYSLQDRVGGKEYETPQFVFMRMAMALSEKEPKETRMKDVAKFYEHFSKKRINAPTPYLVNLGTHLNAFASCNVYTTDDTWRSLAAGDHIAYVMTASSAGIGSHIKTRSVGDKIRGGIIKHQGKLPYYRALVGAINANTQCYAEGTKVLTNKGFVDFKHVTYETLIAQVEDNGSISFVKPLDVIKYQHNGEMVKFSVGEKSNAVKSLVTPNHRVVWRENKHVTSDNMRNKLLSLGGNLKDKYNVAMPGYCVTEANDFTPSRDKIMDFGGKLTGLTDFTPLDALKIAFQADGITKYAGDYCYSFHFSKLRKVVRLRAILDATNIKYTETLYKDGSYGFYVYVGFALTKDFSDITLEDKSEQWCLDFLSELEHWDGSKSDTDKAHKYSNTNYAAVEFVQAVAAACSIYTSVYADVKDGVNTSYSVYISKSKTCTTWRNVKKEVVDYDGFVYCVTVPSGMLVVKYNNNTLVSGNSGRGGAATQHYTAFDPEVEVIQKLKNPMTPASKQVRGLDYSFGSNKFFARLVAKDEDVCLFSYADAPELYEAQYDKDDSKFEKLYYEFVNSDKPRTVLKARTVALGALQEAFDTGRHYLHFTDTMNKHTPFKEKIYSSNLC